MVTDTETIVLVCLRVSLFFVKEDLELVSLDKPL